MKVLCVLNEKGGVGKTTLCALLWWHFAHAGKRVLAIDLDQQANLSHTIEAPAFPAMTLFGSDKPLVADGRVIGTADLDILDIEQTRDDGLPVLFRENLRSADADFDICIIDTPPSLGVRVIAALLAADATVAPIDLGDYSLIGIRRVLDFQRRVAEHFEMPQPEFLGLLPSRFDRKSPRERALFEQLAAADGVPVFRGFLTKRDAYARASADRVPPWQMQGTAAREAASEARGLMVEFERLLALSESA